MLPRVLLLAALAAACAAAGLDPDADPTGDEVEILCLLNRFRADPVGELERIMPAGKIAADLPEFYLRGVDTAMFAAEMRQLRPAPPLVIDRRLLRAARLHSQYMIHNGLGHVEQPGKPGFTAANPHERAALAGFTGGGTAEDCFRDAGGPWASSAGFIIDFGEGGPGGMQNGRGHRMNMINAGMRLVGPAAVPHGGRISVTHLLGSGGGRFIGGVAYIDRNRDGRFNAGEGRGGVEVVVGGQALAATWASGGFAAALPEGAKEAVLRLPGGGKAATITRAVPPGDANLWIEWPIPQEEDLAAADRLIAAARQGRAGKDGGRPAAVALYLGSRGLVLDPERSATVAELVGTVGSDLEAARTAVRGAVDAAGEDAKAAVKAAEEARKAWKGTAAEAWFREAAGVGGAVAAVANWRRAQGAAQKPTPTQTRQLIATLESTAKQMTDERFRSRLLALAAEVRREAKI